jgi:surface protein
MVARVLLIGVLFVAATCVVNAVAFDRQGLLDAIVACLAVDPTGVECCNAGANCGVAGILEMPLWNVSGITDMGSMFYQASAFNADISGWDTSSVTTMYRMFYGASAFNADISGRDTSSVTNMVNKF